MTVMLSCSIAGKKNIDQPDIMKTEKKNMGNLLALYPKPMTVIGAKVKGKVNWLVVGHTGIIGHDLFDYHIGENGTPVIDTSPLAMECDVVEISTKQFPTYSYLATGEMIGKCMNLDKKPGMCAKLPMAPDGIIRLSKIEVHSEYLDEYIQYATEVGTVSLRTEPGVLTMYAVSEKENPCMVTILETYASKEAYEAHIASEHFQKYKQGTLHMVKTLKLSDQTPLNPANQINNFIIPNDHE